MIHGVFSNNPISSIDYVLNASAMGKVSLPVEPASLVYSHFKHVSGVPAPEGIKGVAISKLNILDVLIEQMNQIKKIGSPDVSAQLSEDRLDAMIENYGTQIRQANETRVVMPYVPALLSQVGVVFNLTI